jgi:hypothetical protein
MKYISYFLLTIFYLNVFGQPCKVYQDQIKNLISEKTKLQENLDSEEVAYDKLHLKYQSEVDERKKFERLYYIEKSQKEKLQKDLKTLNQNYNTIQAERDKLSLDISQMINADMKSTKQYIDAIIARDNLNIELTKMEDDKDEYKIRFEQRDEAIIELGNIIKKLENEANDKISIREKKVFFNGKEFNYGEEIIFIEFEEGSSNQMIIKREDEYFVERISKLASKYDLKVKVSLIGESSNKENTERVKLAEERVNKVKSKMIVDYNLKADDFSKSRIIKDKARIGVSVRFEKK